MFTSLLIAPTIPYSVDSKEFIAFQQEITSKCPKQFDELEGILL